MHSRRRQPRVVHELPPIPVDCVRDLLGLTRALYLVARERGDDDRATRLARIGEQLASALTLATAGPDSIGRRAAWRHAEDATTALGDIVGALEPAAPVVRASARRVRRR